MLRVGTGPTHAYGLYGRSKTRDGESEAYWIRIGGSGSVGIPAILEIMDEMGMTYDSGQVLPLGMVYLSLQGTVGKITEVPTCPPTSVRYDGMS